MTLALYIAAGVVATIVYSLGAGATVLIGGRLGWNWGNWFMGVILWPVVLPGATLFHLATRPKRPTLPTARVRDE